MPQSPSRNTVAGLAVVFLTAVAGPWLTGAIAVDRLPELAGFILAGMLTAGLSVQARAVTDRAVMPPGFVIVFAALLLFGPNETMLVAVTSAWS